MFRAADARMVFQLVTAVAGRTASNPTRACPAVQGRGHAGPAAPTPPPQSAFLSRSRVLTEGRARVAATCPVSRGCRHFPTSLGVFKSLAVKESASEVVPEGHWGRPSARWDVVSGVHEGPAQGLSPAPGHRGARVRLTFPRRALDAPRFSGPQGAVPRRPGGNSAS